MTHAKLPKNLLAFVLPLFLIIIILVLVSFLPKNHTDRIKFGVTFSPRYAKYMKLDWQKVYVSILDDLGVRNLRVPTYWDILEPELLKYDFSETDYMLQEASKRGAKVILVLGERQPRWPECYIPGWAKVLTVGDRREKLLQFIQKTIERYKQSLPSPDGERKDSPVVAWQVENEPFLESFGENCDSPDKNFLREEIELVRSLSKKTIIMTDSGELGFWVTPMQLSDVFGTTLYRQVYDKYFGYLTYPLLPYFYSVKSSLIERLFAPNNKKTIISELQAEPWLANGVFESADQQAKVFTTKNFKDYVSFAQKTGFDEVYLWGVEWWYFMAAHSHPEYLDYAGTLFK